MAFSDLWSVGGNPSGAQVNPWKGKTPGSNGDKNGQAILGVNNVCKAHCSYICGPRFAFRTDIPCDEAVTVAVSWLLSKDRSHEQTQATMYFNKRCWTNRVQSLLPFWEPCTAQSSTLSRQVVSLRLLRSQTITWTSNCFLGKPSKIANPKPQNAVLINLRAFHKGSIQIDEQPWFDTRWGI